MTRFAETLAAQPEVLKLRLHLPETYDNAEPAPPAPNVDHLVPAERSLIAVVEIAFETPMTRRAFFESDAFRTTIDGQKAHIASPRDAKTYGIETIYQTLALADNVDAAANIFLGREILTPWGTLDDSAMESQTRKVMARLNPNFQRFKDPVADLTLSLKSSGL
eukprot:gene42682-53228_t